MLVTLQGPPSWHPAPAELKEACKRAAAYAGQHGSSIITLAIKDALQNPAISCHLVGFTKPEQVIA
jgi:L-galactose dehydrogenase